MLTDCTHRVGRLPTSSDSYGRLQENLFTVSKSDISVYTSSGTPLGPEHETTKSFGPWPYSQFSNI